MVGIWPGTGGGDGSEYSTTLTVAGTLTASALDHASAMRPHATSTLYGSGYLWRASLPNMIYNDLNGRGDWQWVAWVYPTSFSNYNTIMYHETDSNNYHWLYADSTGKVHYSIVKSGAEVLHVDSGATLLTANQARNVSIRQAFGRTDLIIDDLTYSGTVVGTSSDNITVDAVGRFQIGASYIAGTAGNYWSGYMDYPTMFRWAAQLGVAQIEMAACNNMPLIWYTHTNPHPLGLRTIFESWRYYSSSVVNVTGMAQQYANWASIGTITDDGSILLLPEFTPDLRLRTTSPANVAGDGVSYLGALAPVSLGGTTRGRSLIGFSRGRIL
jgi:hypothetical protein